MPTGSATRAGSHRLYWTEPRVISGANPVPLGSNNSGRGVGGSMIHYAGYTPRFHPSDFETARRDGVGADWPIGYKDLEPYYEAIEQELPVSGQPWPWGDPHRYPYSPATPRRERRGLRCAAPRARHRDPHRSGGHRQRALRPPPALHLPGVLPPGLQGQRQGVAADHPHPRRLGARRRDPGPRHGVAGRDRRRAGSASGRHLFHQRRRALPAGPHGGGGRATPSRRPASSCSPPRARFPDGLCNDYGQVGRYLMVQGAPQVAGRFDAEVRMYKAPPPEVSSRAVLRDRPHQALPTRVRPAERLPTTHHLCRARLRPGSLG